MAQKVIISRENCLFTVTEPLGSGSSYQRHPCLAAQAGQGLSATADDVYCLFDMIINSILK